MKISNISLPELEFSWFESVFLDTLQKAYIWIKNISYLYVKLIITYLHLFRKRIKIFNVVGVEPAFPGPAFPSVE